MAYDAVKRRQWYLAKREENLAKNKEWRDNNKEYKKKISNEYYHRTKKENGIKYLLKYAKTRATKKGREFFLIESDIIIPKYCPILKVELEFGHGRYSPSIDRIDSNKGYTKDNIQIISAQANRMKGDSSREELLTFCKSVLDKEDTLPC